MDENGLNRLALLVELKRSMQEMTYVECKNRLLGQTRKEVLVSAVLEAGTQSRYVD